MKLYELRCHPDPSRSEGEGARASGRDEWPTGTTEPRPLPTRSSRCEALGVRVTTSALLIISACASPEADRPPGNPGADVKNWGRPVEMHAGAEPYHETPCVTERVECHGPPAVFGPTPPPD
jgi:hypothetical protein